MRPKLAYGATQLASRRKKSVPSYAHPLPERIQNNIISMTLIKSIAGFRGTIGGETGDTLNPLDIVKSVTAFAMLRRPLVGQYENKIVVGRDARISGEMVSHCVCGALLGMGFDVVNIGLATTPTTELAITAEHAAGGIIITASHNPRHWNALKFMDENGEYIAPEIAHELIALVDQTDKFVYADVDHVGHYYEKNDYNQYHIDLIKRLKLVDVDAIRKANFRVCLDTVNSVGGIILPQLLAQLGVKDVTILNGEPTGDFAHNPEPLKQHLGEICGLMAKGGYDIGLVCDPDVDRLVFIQEDGEMYGEEYTLVTCADWVLQHTPGNTVSNLSSTRALRDVTRQYGGTYGTAPVGEVNVVMKMKEINAVVGGEGNGGVIYPEAHYGRDALVGIGLMLTYMAKTGKKVSEIRKQFPEYFISKSRIDLQPTTDVDAILEKVKEMYKDQEITDTDGVKIDFPTEWVHLRKSNTEPIIRVFSEAATPEAAEALGKKIVEVVLTMAK